MEIIFPQRVCAALDGTPTIVLAMLSESSVRNLLDPFGLQLTSHQVSQLLIYLETLLRWNRKINLTAIRTPEECVTRHFGESLSLTRLVEIRGKLLDIGSGAGFPGLALKIAFPDASATLLEPVAKKRAFLKEVARACGMESVEVRAERMDMFLRQNPTPSFDAATARAVGHLEELVPLAVRCLRSGGRLCLWLSHEQAARLIEPNPLIEWGDPFTLPLGREREIWVGTRTDVATD